MTKRSRVLLAVLVVAIVAVGGYVFYQRSTAGSFCPTGLPINNATTAVERRALIERTFGTTIDIDECFGEYIETGVGF